MLTRLAYFSRETFRSLERNLLMTVAGVITVAVSLALVGGTLVYKNYNDNGTAKWQGGVEFEIFMNVDATEQQITDVQTELSDDDEVERYEFLTKQDAYEEFQRFFADEPDLVASITAENLPASFRVVPVSAELTNTMSGRFGTLPGVDEVITPGEALEERIERANIVRVILIGLAVLLLVSAIVLIVNTIRLATFARRREIEVMKLVGASNWFVRIPFLAEGFLQGVLGALVAVPLVYFLVQKLVLEGWIDDQGYYVSSGYMVFVGFAVVLLGAIVGVVASAVGLRRFLDV